ncbi:MAG TPA: triose-phosphate isomerase [Candidatus Omnitrophota bacterium]|nr:triose-phosphate isomerase [Candidatus Omnitrophota bacterium]HOX09167.1 triose-phosphate isomerase [Candidatus Omnitrophota bacterium]HPN66412.1 triose-phosphate isomerase [Candidatus Omnitrophota bacterium]HRZ66581.1 triose-phosphate isomerase [Candidatus Omnitrophota bacterium]
MRKPIIAGNWKMYKTSGEALELVNGLKSELKGESAVDIVVCPPFTAIAKVADALKGSNIGYGAQDMYWEEEGAFTGEVAPKMITDLGCGYCIIGHSERRTYFHETNDTVNKKVKAALKHGLTPIVCVGERLEERDSGKTFDVVKDHVEGGLSGLTKEDALKVVIAYEPVWAIGTGRTATPEQAQEVHKYIRSLLGKMFGEEVSSKVRIQYGGSVKPDNVKAIMAGPDIDGALVGGASLNVKDFAEIVRQSKR